MDHKTSFLCILVFALIISICVLIFHKPRPSCAQQENYDHPAIHNERSVVFADLSEEEIRQVRDYMTKIPGTSISSDPSSPLSADYLYMIELSLPRKQEVLLYLDDSGPKPAREATAVVFHGSQNIIKEYVVGPLPKPTYHRDVTVERYNRTIPLTARPFTKKEDKLMQEFLQRQLEPLSSLLSESFGINPSQDIVYYDSEPRGMDSGDRQTWFALCRNEEGYFIHPTGFEIFVDHKSTTDLDWHVLKVFYNGQYFDGLSELKQQYEAGSVKKVIYKPGPNYASLKPRKKPTGVGPQQFSVQGKRFSIEENNIVYLDWSFAFGLSTLRGMRVFDVRFRGERIIYELSVQEAISVYGSVTPNLILSDYLDGSMSIGAHIYELVRGVDCPYSATFVDTFHFMDTNDSHRHSNSICVFEHDMGQPLRRHLSETGYGGLANSALVFRTITVLENYDYIWDFIFYQSGSVEAKVHASGYIASSFKLDNNFKYGDQVAENTIGNIHTHFLHFKVDLDISGVKNVFQIKDMEFENISLPWMPTRHTQIPKMVEKQLQTEKIKDMEFENISLPWMPKRHTQIPKMVEKQLQTEKEAALRNDATTPRLLHVASTQTNRWGHPRSYRLQVFSNPGDHLPESQEEEKAISWARYKVAITKYKDREQSSSSLYNQHDMWDPPVDFSKYLEDNENIVNEDLVAWVSTGFLHIPHAEDIPNTVTLGNGGGVLLRPHNYFDEDPSIHSADGVYIEPHSETSCDNNRVACLAKETDCPVLEHFSYRGFDED